MEAGVRRRGNGSRLKKVRRAAGVQKRGERAKNSSVPAGDEAKSGSACKKMDTDAVRAAYRVLWPGHRKNINRLDAQEIHTNKQVFTVAAISGGWYNEVIIGSKGDTRS
ncbi:MAG: hypothetical protein ACLR23_07095 [Clostridia bacterium]